MNQSKNPAMQAGTPAAHPAAATQTTPTALGWENPNQRWSGFWLTAFLLMIPVDLAAAYFTRNWGIFQWVPGIALGGYTLSFFLHTFIPTKPDLRTPEEKVRDQALKDKEDEEAKNEPYSLNFGLGFGLVHEGNDLGLMRRDDD